MKKIVFILLGLSLSLTVFSQRLNDKGEKMVKEFTYKTYDRGKVDRCDRYIYDYDQNGRMTSLKIYDKTNNLKGSYANDGRKVSYFNDMTDHCKTNFTLDRYGNITSFEFIEFDYTDKKTPDWKTEYLYEYVYEEEFKAFRLKRFLVIGYDYSLSKKQFIKHETFIERNVVLEEGIYKGSINGSISDDWRYKGNYDHPNDTNMSFYMLLGTNLGYDCLYTDPLLNTEWINVKSPYFPTQKQYNGHTYEYVYDSNGNIEKIKDILVDRNVVCKEIEIIYLD